MINYYKQNIQFYVLLVAWLVIGTYGGPLIYAVLPLSVFLLWKKEMYEEVFISYFFILILSDNLNEMLFFAKNLKNLYAAILGVLFFFNIKKFQPLNQLYKLYIPFFIFSVFTLCFSINDPFFFTSIQKTISYFLSFLIIPNFLLKLYRDHGTVFFKRFIFFCTGTLLLGFLLKYLAHNFVYIDSGRYRGIMGNPNGLGIYTVLIFITFFLIDDFFPELFNKKQKLLIYFTIVLSILISSSRNAIFALAMFYLCQKFFSRSTFLGFILFIFGIVITEIISANFASIIISLGLGDYFRIETLNDGSGRYTAWKFAWDHIQQNFFIGKGFAYNEFYMRQYYGLLSKLGHQGGIHNSFLTFWMDQGLIGLIIFLRSFLLMFVAAAKKTKFAYPILFTVCFTAMFESWLVGSLSAYAFLGVFIFTFITCDEIVSQKTEKTDKTEEQNTDRMLVLN